MYKKLVITLCVAVVAIMFGIVRAADPISSILEYYNSTNSFSVNLTPDAEGEVSLYYADEEGNIDAIFGSEGDNLPAETCSTGVCVADEVAYGVAKIYVEAEKWLYTAKFKVIDGFVILEEETIPDIDPEDVEEELYLGSPPENRLLQLSELEKLWLENRTISSPSATPTATATPTIEDTAESFVSVLAASISATLTLTPSPTPSDPQIPATCSNGEGWVNAYVPSGTTQGLQKNGMPVPAYRTSPTYGFNLPDDLYYSTGVGGVVTYKFPGKITDLHDADGETDFSIYEVTLGRSTYPEEKATVKVSQDGINWFTLSQIARGRATVTGVTSIDFHETALPWIQYVRLTDISVYPATIPEADGFDINAIGGRDQICAPTATPTKTPTLTPTKPPTITLTPSPTPADPVLPPLCTEGQGYLNEYISGAQGTQQDGLPVPAYRTGPSFAYGPPDAIYYTLGIGGNAVYKFPGIINDVSGTDFSVYEETLGRATYPIERAQLEVSMDGIAWSPLTTIATSRANVLGITTVDFSETGLSEIQYIRFSDITVPVISILESDGFDINSVVAESQTCPPEGDPGLLTIRKFNTSGVQSPGGEVTYFMEIEAQQNPVDNVEVLDLPPEDFEYIPNSWTAVSGDTSRGTSGDLKAGGITTQPTYASPGTWKLGNMSPGEKVTLSYKVKISNNIDGGTYTDLAWTQGEDGAVLGDGVSSSYVNNEFVGTEVTVARNTQTTASINVQREEKRVNTTTGNVLGASTRKLPATGASDIWIWVAGIIAALGGISIYAGFRLLKNDVRKPSISKKASHVFLAAILFMCTASAINAAAFTTIRISIPQDKINTNSFRIGFVTLDSEERALTVQCFKKGPSDASFIPFGSPIVVQPGGNSGFCNVDSSVVGQSGANYQFRASAKAAGDPEVYSQTVGTSYSNQGPGTPFNYNKEQAGCTYKIRFRTANDGGKTKKVEIYRSENTSFTADNGTKVGEVLAGSNQSKLFENTPECGKRFYYVIRAFDDFGNGSGLTGDSEVTVTTTTTNTTTTSTTQTTTGGGAQTGGAIPVQGGGNVAAPGAGETGGDTEPADVLGDAAEDNEPPTEEAVLGANTTTEEIRQKEARQQIYILLGVIAAIILGNITYVYVKNRARK